MDPKNLILITVEELRADRLPCYGYEGVKTPNIDRIASEGVVFDCCIVSSCLTPVCVASVLTGVNPPVHGMKDPLCYVHSRRISEILKDRGYETAGFVGNGLLTATRGFCEGFDFFDEPTEEESYQTSSYSGSVPEFWLGNWWIERMLDWLRQDRSSSFFVWGHVMETHALAEYSLLDKGLIEEGRLSDFGYFDAKVELLDRAIIGPLVETLEELGVFEETVLAIMGDHGTNLAEHPIPPYPDLDLHYPQHVTMYDCDLHVALILRGPGLPESKRVKGMVRAIDVTPTALDLLSVSTMYQFDGVTLLPFIKEGEAKNLVAYAEELFERRGPGDFQAVRTDRHKYIVDRRHDNAEEFYNLASDPGEQVNITDALNEEERVLFKEARELADSFFGAKTARLAVPEEEREKIKARLRMLGYIR